MGSETKAKGEIVINEDLCKGCGFCEEFCKRGCISLGDKLSSKGYIVAQCIEKDKTCNACQVCAWMCPEFAIDVYKYEQA